MGYSFHRHQPIFHKLIYSKEWSPVKVITTPKAHYLDGFPDDKEDLFKSIENLMSERPATWKEIYEEELEDYSKDHVRDYPDAVYRDIIRKGPWKYHYKEIPRVFSGPAQNYKNVDVSNPIGGESLVKLHWDTSDHFSFTHTCGNSMEMKIDNDRGFLDRIIVGHEDWKIKPTWVLLRCNVCDKTGRWIPWRKTYVPVKPF